MIFLKRIYIWLKRFRYRKGYGVHSPFAFSLLTDVVYERLPYYAYSELKQLRRQLPKEARKYPERVDKLLFRLVNRFRPQRVLEVGTGAGLSLCYLAAGRVDAQCVSLPGTDASGVVDEVVDSCKNVSIVSGPLLPAFHREVEIEPGIGLLHIARTPDFAQVFENFLQHAEKDSLVVVQGIHDTKAKRKWWSSVVADERTGITFDLYDLGLVFFDRTKNKQHYVVNF